MGGNGQTSRAAHNSKGSVDSETSRPVVRKPQNRTMASISHTRQPQAGVSSGNTGAGAESAQPTNGWLPTPCAGCLRRLRGAVARHCSRAGYADYKRTSPPHAWTLHPAVASQPRHANNRGGSAFHRPFGRLSGSGERQLNRFLTISGDLLKLAGGSCRTLPAAQEGWACATGSG
jgi:hypothetical protein